jgi:predicted nucleic acid-binding protein
VATEKSVIVLDTNLLIYAHRAGSPESRAARRVIDQAAKSPGGWGFTHNTITEFWCVVTHPAIEGPSRPQQARDFLRGLTKVGAHILAPADRFGERLAQVAADLNIQGPRIFDLAIALTAFVNGATELWTHDSGFAGIPGLRLHDPL